MSNLLVNLLKKHEGLKLKPYKDSVGKLTIGYGRNLDDVGISEYEANMLLLNDIGKAAKDLNRIFGDSLLNSIGYVRYSVLVNMMFNLGYRRFISFEKMIAAVKAHNYETAADEMIDSKWAGQVGDRSTELAELMRNGEI